MIESGKPDSLRRSARAPLLAPFTPKAAPCSSDGIPASGFRRHSSHRAGGRRAVPALAAAYFPAPSSLQAADPRARLGADRAPPGRQSRKPPDPLSHQDLSRPTFPGPGSAPRAGKASRAQIFPLGVEDLMRCASPTGSPRCAGSDRSPVARAPQRPGAEQHGWRPRS